MVIVSRCSGRATFSASSRSEYKQQLLKSHRVKCPPLHNLLGGYPTKVASPFVDRNAPWGRWLGHSIARSTFRLLL